MNAGYSKRSLVEKLGIKKGARIRIFDPPPHYEALLGTLPEGVTVSNDRKVNFVHAFVTERKKLESNFPVYRKRLETDGQLWISWPKGSSGVKTDLNENGVRDIGLKNGLVDIKVCAIDEVWSGLKFVYRRKDR